MKGRRPGHPASLRGGHRGPGPGGRGPASPPRTCAAGGRNTLGVPGTLLWDLSDFSAPNKVGVAINISKFLLLTASNDIWHSVNLLLASPSPHLVLNPV